MSIDVNNGEAIMTKSSKINKAAACAGSAVVVALALGVASGASAQCVGTYHSNSGSGSVHSATASTGIHSGGSQGASTPSACATSGHTLSTHNLAGVHSASNGLGAGAGKTGATWSHREAHNALNGSNKSFAAKKVKP